MILRWLVVAEICRWWTIFIDWYLPSGSAETVIATRATGATRATIVTVRYLEVRLITDYEILSVIIL